MDDDPATAFATFFEQAEPRLRHALSGAFGAEVGRDAAADALAWAWQHRDRLDGMDGRLRHTDGGHARAARPRPVAPWTGGGSCLSSKLIDPAYLAANDEWTRSGACRFDDDGRLVDLALLDADPWAEHLAFRSDFRAWVSEQHPEVEMRWFPPEGSYSDELARMPTADSMPDALALLEEFLAQSPRWG